MNEPLSMLQKLAEPFEYYDLLAKANKEADADKRMLYVTIFAIAMYASTHERLSKPFNPLLGETYEFDRPEFHFFAEQVSHHPPISAMHVHSADFECWDNSASKSSFWGKSLEIKPHGVGQIVLKRTGERFAVWRPTTVTQNIIFGTMYLEHVGHLGVKNMNTGESANIEFKKKGWTADSANMVEGYTKTAKGAKRFKVFGKWHQLLYFMEAGQKKGAEKEIWRIHSPITDYAKLYNMTGFALQLNYMRPGMSALLPRTDCRFRPDQKALENGEVKLAAGEK